MSIQPQRWWIIDNESKKLKFGQNFNIHHIYSYYKLSIICFIGYLIWIKILSRTGLVWDFFFGFRRKIATEYLATLLWGYSSGRANFEILRAIMMSWITNVCVNELSILLFFKNRKVSIFLRKSDYHGYFDNDR